MCRPHIRLTWDVRVLKPNMTWFVNSKCVSGGFDVFNTCADPEIFMRGGPTKMVIFGHRRGGVQPPINPEITFF